MPIPLFDYQRCNTCFENQTTKGILLWIVNYKMKWDL